MERSRPRVGGYDAVVLGSAIHNQDWLAGSTDFVQRNLGTLAGRPVWLFSVGMLGDQGSAFAPPLSHLFRGMRARSSAATCPGLGAWSLGRWGAVTATTATGS